MNWIGLSLGKAVLRDDIVCLVIIVLIVFVCVCVYD